MADESEPPSPADEGESPPEEAEAPAGEEEGKPADDEAPPDEMPPEEAPPEGEPPPKPSDEPPTEAPESEPPKEEDDEAEVAEVLVTSGEESIDLDVTKKGEAKSEDFSQAKSKSSFGLRSVESRKESMLEAKKKLAERKKFKALGSVISLRKGNADFYDRQKVPKFANSYKLESDKPFNHEKVESILKEVLEEALENLTYDADKVPKQAKWASSAIRAKVKEQEYDRYKIVCVVTIGEKRSQDIYEIVRFLWDADRDKYAKHFHENIHLYAVALCFGLYYE